MGREYFDMMKRTEGNFHGKNDFELFFQTWKSDKSRATLVVTHGLGEHSECYTRLADGMLPGDWDIYAWDLRGHGRSEGKRGTIAAFTDYCEDLKCFVEFVKKSTDGRPMVLLGHSMGGLITANTVIRYGEMGAKAVALSSPLFGISVKVPELKEKAAKMLASFLPNLTLHNELSFDDLTHDRKVVEEYEKDGLRHDRISSLLFVEMVGAMDYALANAQRVKAPFLLQQAGDDRIVSRKASEQFFEKVGSAQKEIKIYEDYYHEIFNETGRDAVFSDLKKWLAPYA